MHDTPYHLFFDFDDTLYLNGKVHKKTERALKRAKKAGCKIYINSGRARGNLMRDLKTSTDFPFDGYLCAFSNAYLGNNAEITLFANYVSEDVALRYIDYCIKYSYWATIEFEETPTHVIEMHGDVKYSEEEYEEFRQKALEVIKGKNIIKFNCCPPKSTNYIATNLQEENPELTFIKGTTYYESLKSGYGKGVLIKKFAENQGIDFNKCIHFGDSANDANGFELAPIGVGMKKTPKEFQHLCSYVAKTDFGVAEYINKVLLRKIKLEKKSLKKER